MKDACGAYFLDADESDELFEALYDRIAHDFGMDRDIDFGSREHKRKARNPQWGPCRPVLFRTRAQVSIGLELELWGHGRGGWVFVADEAPSVRCLANAS